ncbi:hypothetical protein EZV62_015334 [Acer yangbiense]|uniref:F-box domain-containing protein n=1 Tax=Acer yangbiense TaxID=1000413 RepID=A0A5C7HL43_9ROSI|nr:hypothetical protein EZV62_015334 [Acer yangbiense]
MASKRLEKKTAGEDFIGRLPDDVLAHILSRLDTKEAVKTSILSSRWKNQWTSVYNLYFKMPSYVIGEHRRIWLLKFVGFVLSRCQSKEIQDFELKDCYFLRDADLPRLREWMCFAIERNVHNLILKVQIRMERPVIRIPQTILTCKNLVKLNLGNWDAVLDIPDSTVCFPSLKILSIFVEYPDMVLMQKLFQSCPMLEELTIDGHLKHNENALTYIVVVPTLKILKISLYDQ